MWVANGASIWAGLNVSSFNVSLNVAFVSVVFFTEATTPIFDPRLHQTAGLLLNVLSHPLLFHKYWKCCFRAMPAHTIGYFASLLICALGLTALTSLKQPFRDELYFPSHYTQVGFLFVVVHGVARGSDFATHVTMKSHVHMVGLNVPCHIILPLIGVITKCTFEKPPT